MASSIFSDPKGMVLQNYLAVTDIEVTANLQPPVSVANNMFATLPPSLKPSFLLQLINVVEGERIVPPYDVSLVPLEDIVFLPVL